MLLVDTILALKRPRIWKRFRKLRGRSVPSGTDPQEAFHKGLQTGYGEGLIDGVDLGVDVGRAAVVTSDDPNTVDPFPN